MAFFTSFDISASGLTAQRLRMDLTSSNLANAQTTKGPDGKVYKRLSPKFEAVEMPFDQTLDAEVNKALRKVELTGVNKDTTPPKKVYDPGHPDADELGFIELPNVDLMREMADMLMASRAYEANITAFNTTKSMAMKALDIGRV